MLKRLLYDNTLETSLKTLGIMSMAMRNAHAHFTRIYAHNENFKTADKCELIKVLLEGYK